MTKKGRARSLRAGLRTQGSIKTIIKKQCAWQNHGARVRSWTRFAHLHEGARLAEENFGVNRNCHGRAGRLKLTLRERSAANRAHDVASGTRNHRVSARRGPRLIAEDKSRVCPCRQGGNAVDDFI